MSKRILIIDDNEKMCKILQKYLQKMGDYICDTAQNAEQVLNRLSINEYNLITLDIEIGEENGLELIDQIKLIYSGPIIYVSCRRDIKSKITGLKKGADDYITKPFDLEEIYLRITNLIKRLEDIEIITVEPYEIDLKTRFIYKDGKKLVMEKIPTELFIMLLRNKNVVLTRDQIANQIWDDIKSADSRAIDKNISIIRRASRDHQIKTVRGIGYIYEEKV